MLNFRKIKFSHFIFGAISVLSVACTNNESVLDEAPNGDEQILKNNPDLELFDLCYTKHGGDKFNKANYQFEFRGNIYSFQNNGQDYIYEKRSKDSLGNTTIDRMSNNSSFNRIVNNVEIELTEDDKNKYESSLNSVIYFATLPHKLTDGSVNKEFTDVQMFANNKYNLMKVTFQQEGGGEDFDDEYMYWINSKTNEIDFFAYNYTVNGGGARFRSAFNKRVVDGILFQDYINYEAPKDVPLANLLKLYESDSLIKLSEILTENVVGLD